MIRKVLCTAVAAMFFLHFSAQDRTFTGAWFEVKYPSDFTAQGSMVSASGEENQFDSAFFTSPDGEVEFYIFSPQWGGEPTDIALRSNEKAGNRQVKQTAKQTVTHWTIGAQDGSYVRSYQETRNEVENTVWVVGIKYKNQKAYDRYKKQYIAFKSSLQQFAD
ncbi:hypothetical protein [Tannerella forsythia]|uniref:DUF4488 domain-containing protein n=1 Tax=Tannerella forsythia TaxID=28112 RepID=A0A3P1Z2B5_TANFO|nr:hypothetical protein [Tannerella forsythia]RRD76988.1 hypothetical protein EII41_04685 [Tannerella forsythia]